MLAHPPTQVRLTFSEHIEPRFAVISVTDAQGNQQIGRQPGDRARRPEHDLHQGARPSPGLVPGLVARDLGRRASSARRVHVRRRAESRAAAAVRHPVARRERGHAEPRQLSLGAAGRAAGVRRAARVPRRDRAAAAGARRERARPARRHDRPRESRSPSRWSPRPSTSSSRLPSSHSDPGPISARSCRSCATRASAAPSATSGACSALLARRIAASPCCSTGPAARAAPARRCSPSSARSACAAAALALPGPRRPPVDDQPRRGDARARLGAPRRGVDLDRRAPGPARAGRGE